MKWLIDFDSMDGIDIILYDIWENLRKEFFRIRYEQNKRIIYRLVNARIEAYYIHIFFPTINGII